MSKPTVSHRPGSARRTLSAEQGSFVASAGLRSLALIVAIAALIIGVLAAHSLGDSTPLQAAGQPTNTPTAGPTPTAKPEPTGNLSGVYDVNVYTGSKSSIFFHCILRLDHEAATNRVKAAAQCVSDIGIGDPNSAVPPLPGESVDNNGDTFLDLDGPPPPPPYTAAAPAKGNGTYDPFSDDLTFTFCFPNLGGIVGPNLITVTTLSNVKGDLATLGKITGTVDVHSRQSIAQCDAKAPSGIPVLNDQPLNLNPITDGAPCPGNDCEQAPWRTPNDTDYDDDGCTDAQELDKTGASKCGDDPWNPHDSNAADIGGSYSILNTGLRADWDKGTNQLVPGIYGHCLADLQHDTGTNALTARLYCYTDSPLIQVNPQANDGAGDGLPGAAPPAPFGDVDDVHTQLTGSYDKTKNTIELSGCFEDRDGFSPFGHIYVRTVGLDVHTGHGHLLTWVLQTQANCLGGTPAGAPTKAVLDIVRQASKAANRDTDGDGCPDKKELGNNQTLGGLRDPFNRWDYFNPTKDGLNRVDDILAVVNKYGIDKGEPGYTASTDRTVIVGANDWNLGPPDGNQRVDDIIMVGRQFGHDCPGGAVVQPPPQPTPTSAPAPEPAEGLNFSIGIDEDGDTIDDCRTKIGLSKCSLPAGSGFTVRVYLDSLPVGVSAYEAFEIRLDYTGLSSKDNASSSPWPDCDFPAAHYEAGRVWFTCSVFLSPPSTYTGLIGTSGFNCTGTGTITLVHGQKSTRLVEELGVYHQELSSKTEALNVNCGEAITPGSTGTLGRVGNKVTIQAGSTVRWSCDPADQEAAVTMRFHYTWGTEDVSGTGTVTFTHVPPTNILTGVQCIVNGTPGAILTANWIKLIDPSGVVFDIPSGLPIPEAFVTLQIEDPPDSGTYRTVDPVSDAAIKEPDVNPETTGLDGRYAWDVAPGRYRVVVSRATCTSATSPPVDIPPPVTDLDVGITCKDNNSNGIPDIIESLLGISDPNGDDDGDGLTNLEEINFGTDPLVRDDVDKDGDGCINLKKLSPGAYRGEFTADQLQGGRRNDGNRWDYFNPSGDLQNRVDDILDVVNQYFEDEFLPSPPNPPNTPNPNYTPTTDRTLVGPNLWNLGPPNGQQRVDDILHAVNQYFHDCA